MPLLAVSGQVDSSREQFWTHQLIDHKTAVRPVTSSPRGWTRPSADTVLRRALRTATAERPGAVHLTVTTDSFGESGAGTGGRESSALTSAGAGLELFGEEPLRALRAARGRCCSPAKGAVRSGATGVLTEFAAHAGCRRGRGDGQGGARRGQPVVRGDARHGGHQVIWKAARSRT